ncbi:guanylin-like [Brienomyrus brachyistius]|uniref:guanylin-like n=1 Tax=Brienomyrus brachyistius TaxID=42636 RepID=UPI0020B44E43|nr:guanylin-like [Brienomyrus brachyistius]
MTDIQEIALKENLEAFTKTRTNQRGLTEKMNTKLPLAVLLAVLCTVSQAVQVKEGEFSFSLESVKMLKELMDSSVPRNPNPRLAATTTRDICIHPALPDEFKQLCRTKKASVSMHRLGVMALNSDICEICAFAACTGC